MPKTSTSRPLSPREVAEIFGVSPTTIATWADRGLIPHFRTPGGQRRFRPEDIEQFLDDHPVKAVG